MLTDASGEAVGTFSYTPYGTLEGSTGAATTPLGFAGQYTDPETGLQFLRARFYDPATGQFMSRDPIEALTREPYAYAANDPVNMVDRSGHFAVPVFAGAGCAVGGTAIPVIGCPGGAVLGVAAGAAAAGAAWAISDALDDDSADDAAEEGEAWDSNPEESCDGPELKREGEELLGRGHSQAGQERWKEWWDSLSKAQRKAYRRVRGPRPRSRH